MPSVAEPWARGTGATTTNNLNASMSTPSTPFGKQFCPAEPSSQTPPPSPAEPHLRVLFPLGHLVATPGALRTLARFNTDAMTLICRHVQGDWGDVCGEDQHANDMALVHGTRLLSAYTLRRAGGTTPDDSGVDTCTVWLITEWDRSVTTLLLPSEY